MTWQVRAPATAQIADEVLAAAARGLNEAAEHVLSASNRDAPKLTRALIKSGRVDKATARRLIARLAYSKRYAPFVHEDMTAEHPKGGKAKFLEQAFLTERSRVAQIVAEAIKRET